MQQTILLTNQLATGSAFALTENNENVFIPSKVMFGHSVRLGQRVQAVCVPNMTRPDRTPWLAVSILEAAPAPQEDALAEMILDLIESDGRGTVEEIATSLNMANGLAAAKVSELVASGQLVRVVCYDLPEEDA
ncbi:hypothetical protein UFOVP373_53 [uncultured Caudovirales phage]|uniref:Uncharacterized protein n=1 Tax=uncultured Caudovirales phage TaxID=2100421 RepID=A0A6J7X1S9_9CAUD|nr:hypothetical protein UFOVP373_53 [uncultured Caudovirales phage]